MLTEEEFAAWFRLLETPGLGRDSARVLLTALGSPEEVFCARPETLRALVGPEVTAALARIPDTHAQRWATALAWLRGGPQRHVLTLGDADYPRPLLETADPPLLLYVQGDVSRLNQPGVAIVGSRSASAQGRDTARAIAAELSQQGWVVVSGLAHGIDGAAHEGALAAGPVAAGTVAVVGTGLDIVYPPRHAALAQRIAAAGAVLSEYAPGTPPLPQHFPQRNRIIAGLSQGTLVVEAALRSGSLITARLALEAGRDVFAVPGSIHAEQSKGCNALIKQGAKLVESAADIVEELRQPALPFETPAPPAAKQRGGARPALGPGSAGTQAAASAKLQPPDDGAVSALHERDAPILAAMGFEPMSLDMLLARCGWPVADLTARLLELELDGWVTRLPGGLYQRRVLS